MKLLLSIAACLIAIHLSAQKSPIKFGDIPIEDLELTVYPEDESAAAVILEDYGEAYASITNIDSKLNFERHVRVKILKKEGLKWGDVSIMLHSSEGIRNFKATTYNLENGIVTEDKLSKSGVFLEKINRNYNRQKFTMPNVKEGSIIEYSYVLYSDYLASFPNWQFQYSIPVRHSEYWAMIPDFFVMQKYMQGYLSTVAYEEVTRQKSGYAENAYHWKILNVPAFKEEPYITCEKDYVSKINFALAYINYPSGGQKEIMGSWGRLNHILLESDAFGKIISGSGFLKKKVEEIVENVTDSTEIINTIYTYIKTNLEWDEHSDYLADPLKEVFDKKKGTSGDINLALASMLEKAGIKTEMVLLSTRDHGIVRKMYPMSRQFNYVICAVKVNGTVLYLDATDKYLPMGLLPERCLNGDGLVISKEHFGWVNLDSKVKRRTIINANLRLESANELKGEVTYVHQGYDAYNARKSLLIKGEEDYLKDVVDNHSAWQVSRSAIQNSELLDQPLNETHEFSVSDHVVDAGDVVYINPFVADQLEQNPFKLEQRLYPIDFGSLKEKIYMIKFEVPEGYQIDDLPKSKVFALPDGAGKFLYNVSVVGNIVGVTSQLAINKSVFIQEEYPYLKELYNIVVAKQAEQIVIKKKP